MSSSRIRAGSASEQVQKYFRVAMAFILAITLSFPVAGGPSAFAEDAADTPAVVSEETQDVQAPAVNSAGNAGQVPSQVNGEAADTANQVVTPEDEAEGEEAGDAVVSEAEPEVMSGEASDTDVLVGENAADKGAVDGQPVNAAEGDAAKGDAADVDALAGEEAALQGAQADDADKAKTDQVKTDAVNEEADVNPAMLRTTKAAGRDVTNEFVTGLTVQKGKGTPSDAISVEDGHSFKAKVTFDAGGQTVNPGDYIIVNWPTDGDAYFTSKNGSLNLLMPAANGTDIHVATIVFNSPAEGFAKITFNENIKDVLKVKGWAEVALMGHLKKGLEESKPGTITSGDKNAQVTVTPAEQNQPKKYFWSKKGTLDPDFTTVHWTVEINKYKDELIEGITLKDTLGAGLSLASEEAVRIVVQGKNPGSYTLAQFRNKYGYKALTYDKKSGKIHISLSVDQASGNKFIIKYDTLIDENYTGAKLNNKVNIDYQVSGVTRYDPDSNSSVSNPHNRDFFTKNGHRMKHGDTSIDWTLVINAPRADLDTAVYVTDVLEPGQEFLTNEGLKITVTDKTGKLTTYVGEAGLNEFNQQYSVLGITPVNFKDSTHLEIAIGGEKISEKTIRVDYRTKITDETIKKYENTATANYQVKGGEPQEIIVKPGVDNQNIGGGVEGVQAGVFKIEKVTADNKHVPIPGVEFSIYNSVNGEAVGDPVEVIVTDDSGICETKFLEVGSYIAKETNGPNWVDWNRHENSYAFEIEAGAAEGIYQQISNEVIKTSVDVEKQWVGPVANQAVVKLLADGNETNETLTLTADTQWKGTFEGLQKFDAQDGHEIQYTVEEVALDGYTSQVTGTAADGFVVTNTNVETVTFDVAKSWVGPEAESVTLELQKADGTPVEGLMLTADKNWAGAFGAQPKYDKQGNEIAYQVVEVAVNGEPVDPAVWQVEVAQNENTFQVTNTNVAKTQVAVEKQWVGPAAESATVTLLADDVDTGKQLVLSQSNNWTGSFANLPQYDATDGHAVTYTIDEVAVDGYTTQISGNAQDGFVVKNVNVAKNAINVVKQWVGPAAESATFKLFADGVDTGKKLVLTAAKDWMGSFENLAQYDATDGHEIQYTVKEVALEGYDSTVKGSAQDGFTFTNVNVAKTQVAVEKQWVGPAAESVTINLLADGAEVQHVVLNKNNNWKYTFTGLSKYNATDGHEIEYTVIEAAIPNYTSQVTGTAADGFVVTNTNVETVTFDVAKSWVGPEAESVTLELQKADGTPVEGLMLTADKNWAGAFGAQPKYDKQGNEIAYQVVEVAVNGEPVDPAVWQVEVAQNENTFQVTNTNVETVSVPVEKRWVGPGAESVVVGVYEPVADKSELVKTIELNATNSWKGVFTDLPKYNEFGMELDYIVKEISVDGQPVADTYYDSWVEEIEGVQVVFNLNSKEITYSVEKRWIGPGAESVTVQLKANGETVQELVLKAETQWQGSFDSEYVYDEEGKPIEYTLEEVAVNGEAVDSAAWQTEVTQNENSFVVTNTNTAKTQVAVEKQWVGPAAESVTINLLADGAEVQHVVLNKSNDWKYTFTGLSKYNATDGHEIQYTVQEPALDGYASVVTGSAADGFVVTNTNIAKTTVDVTKQWIGPAAENVTINLLADGNVVDEVVLNKDNNWTHQFAGLAQYDATDGHEIEYAINEVALDGYDSVITGTAAEGFVVTNTNTAKVNVPVEKQWIGPAAESATVTLLADDVDTGKQLVLSQSNNWTGSFANLPQYDATDGHAVTYTIDEVAVDGYTTQISGNAQDGFVVKNVNVAKNAINVVKQWVGPAAESATFKLFADGVDTGKQLVLTAAKDWMGSFENLAQYDATDGHEIQYTVKEVALEGYDSTVKGSAQDGFTFTNVNTAKTQVTVEKQWVGPAAESVTINLLADGAEVQHVVLNKSNDWKYTFTGLSKYNATDGHEIQYTVQEPALDGYASVVTGSAADGFVVTNTNIAKTTVDVTKQWIGPAAENVTINLLADGNVVDEVVLNKDNNWTHQFAGLAQYDAVDGHKIVYTVEEVAIEGYASEITGDVETGFVVTNTYIVASEKPAQLPKTGDSPLTHVLMGLSLLAAAGAAIAVRRLRFE